MPKSNAGSRIAVSTDRPRDYFSTFLADGVTTDFTGNYAGSPIEPQYVNPAILGKDFYVYQFTVKILDNGGFSINDYGNIAALANGVEVFYEDEGGREISITGGMPILTNLDWDLSSGSGLTYLSFGAGPNACNIIWTVKDVSGAPGLRITPGRRFFVRLNDNFSGLVGHFFKVNGFYYTSHKG